MRVGVLGSGDVAQALGKGFASRGHDVKLGSRTPQSEKLAAWLKGTEGKASTGTFPQTAEHGELLVLSVHGTVAEEVIRLAGNRHFEGKILIDTTNPLDTSKGFPPGLFVGVTDSLAERIQRALPKTRVVKAFNTISSLQMVDPKFSEPTPEMMICGHDSQAKVEVSTIVRSFGWPGTLDLGGIEMARWMEAFVPLWVAVGMKIGTWSHGVRWVR